MHELPAQLVECLPPDDAAAVRGWWERLPDTARTELAAAWDQAREECFFGTAAGDGEDGDEDAPPEVIGGQFIPHDDAWRSRDWKPDHYEYLLEHPEVVMLYRTWDGPTFHLCTAHAAARAALAAGRIPADFACPFADAGCPMRKALAAAPGHDLQLLAVSRR